MDRHLFDVLWEVYRDVDARQPINIVSAYRSPATNAMLRRRSAHTGVARFSQHMLGHAMDFFIPGVQLEKIRFAGLRLQRGGVGFYPKSGSPFVHLDTGHVRHWPRMTHDQLVRVFPNGRTVHIPSDGNPLPGYELAMADIELMDRLIAGGAPAHAADLRTVRLGVARPFYANLDDDTRAVMDDAAQKMKAAGVTLVEVEMPRLMELAGAVGFPLALYEAHDDVGAYLKKYRTGVTLEQLAAAIASPDVKGTYQGLVLPRKLPGPNGTVVDARPAYEAAIREGRPALRKLYADTFAKHRLDALVFPTVTRVAIASNPESSSIENFIAYIQNSDPGSDAGLPGLTLPVALGAASRLPVGLEIDGPVGSDRRLISIGMALERVFGRLPPPAR